MGDAVGLAHVVQDKFVVGVQLYVPPPVAVRVVLSPTVMLALEAVAPAVGEGLTVMAILVSSEQEPIDAVTVYVVFAEGLTIIEVEVAPPGFHK